MVYMHMNALKNIVSKKSVERQKRRTWKLESSSSGYISIGGLLNYFILKK